MGLFSSFIKKTQEEVIKLEGIRGEVAEMFKFYQNQYPDLLKNTKESNNLLRELNKICEYSGGSIDLDYDYNFDANGVSISIDYWEEFIATYGINSLKHIDDEKAVVSLKLRTSFNSAFKNLELTLWEDGISCSEIEVAMEEQDFKSFIYTQAKKWLSRKFDVALLEKYGISFMDEFYEYLVDDTVDRLFSYIAGEGLTSKSSER